MPEYSKADIQFTVEREDLIQMMKATDRPRDQLLLALLWMSGGRPAEIVELKKEDCKVEETSINLELITKKQRLGKGKWKYGKRVLEFKRPLPPHEDKLLDFVADHLKHCNEGKLFPISTRRVEQIIEVAGQKGLRRFICPYNFRHGRMLALSKKGATIDELLQFKGSSDVRSVAPYLKAKKFKVEL